MPVKKDDIVQLKWKLEQLNTLYQKKHPVKSVTGHLAPFFNYTGKPANVGILDAFIRKCSIAIQNNNIDKAESIFTELEAEFLIRAKEIYLKNHSKKESAQASDSDSECISYFIKKLNRKPNKHTLYRGIGTILKDLPPELATDHANLFHTLTPDQAFQEMLHPTQVMPSPPVASSPSLQATPILPGKITDHIKLLQEKIKKNAKDKVSIAKVAVLEKAKAYLEAGESLKNHSIVPSAYFEAKTELERCMRDNFIYYTASNNVISSNTMSNTETLVDQVIAENQRLHKDIEQRHEAKEVKTDEASYPFTILPKNRDALMYHMDTLKGIIGKYSLNVPTAKRRAQKKLYRLAKEIVYGKSSLSTAKLNYLKEMLSQYDAVYVTHINGTSVSTTGGCISRIINFAEESLQNHLYQAVSPPTQDGPSPVADKSQPSDPTSAETVQKPPEEGPVKVHTIRR